MENKVADLSTVSLLWKSLVMAKKHSVASVVPRLSPWFNR